MDLVMSEKRWPEKLWSDARTCKVACMALDGKQKRCCLITCILESNNLMDPA